jgi:hypothetical protein
MAYGSRPDILPDFVLATTNSGGVRLLDLAESQKLESLSLNRFPPMSSVQLDWAGVPGIEQLVYMDEESGAQLLRDLLQSRLRKADRVVVFWDNLIIPSVSLPVDLVLAHADEVLDVGRGFWLFAAEDNILIEFLLDGQVTVAPVGE